MEKNGDHLLQVAEPCSSFIDLRYETDTLPNSPQQMACETSYFLVQVRLVDGLYLSDVDYACFGQITFTFAQTKGNSVRF